MTTTTQQPKQQQHQQQQRKNFHIEKISKSKKFMTKKFKKI